MIKKLSLLLAACTLLAGNAFADDYIVTVYNNISSHLYLTQAYEVSGCQVYWPDSGLPVGGTSTFTIRCNEGSPFGLKLSYITDLTRQSGQTCWTTYYKALPIDNLKTHIIIYNNFISYGTCGSSVTPPVILLSHPDPSH